MTTPSRNPLLAVLIASVALAIGCQEQRADRDYVQTNVVDKSLFEGEWYYTHTIVDNDHESTYAWAYRGSVSFDQTNSVIGTAARIRFVVDEDWLYAYRSYPVVDQADRRPDGARDVDLFEPMAAWPIESHFDIVRRYNPSTGEVLNVVEENQQDRPWYERAYMRIDWAGNALVAGYNFNDLDVFDPLNIITRQAAPSFSQEGSPWPEQWAPRFDFTPVEEPERASWEWEYWDRYGPERLYHFTFVTQEIWSPGIYPFLYSWALPWQLQYGGELSTSASLVSVRHSFLRVPDENQYEPLHMPEDSWERFGAWRVEQPVYSWGDLPDEENGLTNFYGQTDALNFWAGRHNIWRQSYRYDDEGRPQPIPMSEREVQPVVYTLTEGFPAWLIQPAFDLIGEWNGVMMETVRTARGRDLPNPYFPGSSCETDADCLRDYGDIYRFTSCRASYGDPDDRQCTRGYNPFVEPNDTLGDYDCYIVDAEGNLPEDPELDLADFDDERLASQRGWHFVGEECVLILRNNTCDDPRLRPGAIESHCLDRADRDLETFEDCQQRLANDPSPVCDQMGDLRFNFLAHNDQVGVMWGGVSQPLMDPITGELIQANANAAMLSVEGAMTIVGWYFDLVDGDNDEIDELSYMVGEDVRAMMESSNYAIPPVTPAIPPSLSDSESALPGVQGTFRSLIPRMERSMELAWTLRGQEGRARIFSDRLLNLEGTTVERSLFSGADGMLSLGFMPEDYHAAPTEEQLDHASPFRNGVFRSEMERQALFDRMSRRNFAPSADQNVAAFVDNSYVNWLRDYEGLNDRQRAIATGRAYFRGMMIHEMGHSLGMRHNFAGSLDYQNYHDQYYHIEDQDPLPVMPFFREGAWVDPDGYDADGDGQISYEEIGRYNADLNAARLRREEAGVARWHNSSVMEYMPRISNDLAPLGRYDRGFIHFVYGNQVEVYTNHPAENAVRGTTRNHRSWMLRPDRADRTFEQFFVGGETCRIDRDTRTGDVIRYHHEDCPYGVIWIDPVTQRGRACSDNNDEQCPAGLRCNDEGWCISRALPEGQVVGQRCGENPRAGQTAHSEDLPGVCYGYDRSWESYRSFVDVPDIAVFPVGYRFCSDERTNDISWCSRFDEGENFVEIMHHFRDRWDRSYPFSFFRRYRRNYGGTSNFGTYRDVAKVMSHFYYRYIYENIYENDDGRWIDSINDYLAGAAAGLNFLAEVVAQPDVGDYQYDPDTNTYERMDPDDTSAPDLTIEPGMGRYMWSSYQEGPFGIGRLERMGSYNDKLYALLALARRNWGSTLLFDEQFWINFYEMFPYEMNQLFGGLILDDATLYGPRVCREGEENPFMPGTECERDTILYQDLWRGSFSFDETEPRGNPYDDVYRELPAINGGSNELLRVWAIIFSLAEFPIFYDTTYEQQLYLFVEGSGDSFNVHDCEDFPDDPTCVVEGEDYIRYFSDRFNLNFVAFQVEPQWDWEPESVNPTFVLLERAQEYRTLIEVCEEGLEECPVRSGSARQEAIREWRAQLEESESFMLTLLDIQSTYGISSWL